MSDDYILNKAKNELRESGIDPEVLKEFNVILAGGALTSIVTNREINDFDFYFSSNEDLLGFLHHLCDEGFFVKFFSDKSVTLCHYAPGKEDLVIVQLIFYKLFDNAQDLFSTFDFTINKCAIVFKTESVVCADNFMLHNSSRYLEYGMGSSFPLLSLFRVRKYEERGYTISKSQLLKIIFDIRSLEINSWDDLSRHIGSGYKQEMLDTSGVRNKEFTEENLIEFLDGIEKSFITTACEDRAKYWDIRLFEELITGEIKESNDFIFNGGHIRALRFWQGVGLKREIRHHIETKIGKYLFKFVTSDLKSKHYNYQYKMYEWNEATLGDKNFYMCKDQSQGSQWTSYGNTVIICEYDIDSVVSIDSNYIKVKRVKPVMKIEGVTSYSDIKKVTDAMNALV